MITTAIVSGKPGQAPLMFRAYLGEQFGVDVVEGG